MRIRKIKIAPGQAFELTAAGNYVRVRYSAVDLTIENMDKAGEIVELSQGDDVELSSFKNLRISHDSLAEQEVKLLIATNKKAGSSQVSGTISFGAGGMSQSRATVSNAASVQLLPANTARKYLLIQNNDLSTVMRLTLDGSAAKAGEGFRIEPGASFELATYAAAGAINAIMETATAAADNVEILEG